MSVFFNWIEIAIKMLKNLALLARSDRISFIGFAFGLKQGRVASFFLPSAQ